MGKDLILEVGLEEVPARFMSGALQQLAGKAEEQFRSRRLVSEGIKTYGTPRRLTLIVKGLEEQQQDGIEEIKGPPVRAAYDAEGQPTRAATGFARSQGVQLEDLVTREIEEGSYVFAVKKTLGGKTITVLPELLPGLITSLTFPKSMRWGEEELRFVRPIRWLLALYGNEVVPLELAGVSSSSITYGHRFLSKGRIELQEADQYSAVLEREFVLVDQNRRMEQIKGQIENLAALQAGRAELDPELLEEVTYLVEYPTAICGKFKAGYLDLPDEVLITPMREHQRYFPVRDSQGKLKPLFITVKNGTAENAELVARGNEKVLTARLEDARFFWEEDNKVPLRKRVEELDNVVFQEELGSILAKVQRIGKLAEKLLPFLNSRPGLQVMQKVALLAKADLVTNMVYEFPELQGIMGSYYAARQGEPEEVCMGIREHYLPRFAGDSLPETPAGMAVALADKLDSLVGYFGLGLKPSGSQDPYALRRQTLGIISILLGREIDFSLETAIREAYRLYNQDTFKLDEQAIVQDITQFFAQRLLIVMEDRGFTYDIAGAVLAVAADNPLDVLKRCSALAQFRQIEGFEALLAAYTRVNNLAKKAGDVQVDPELFETDNETRLWSALLSIRERVGKLVAEKNYLAALREMSTLSSAIDNFFETVMVMVDAEKIRNNRLGLLRQVADHLTVVADLSRFA